MQDEKLIRILKSIPLFAKNFLVIHDKSGKEQHFEMNRAQLYVHERLEAQLKATGRVRALVLKGRQQGISTYIQARFFHQTVTRRGKKSFILTHQADSTRALFEMTKRYSENVPPELFPIPDKNNENTLMYNRIGSGYRVGTAGSVEVGRGMTNQNLHLSEYAFYKDADKIGMGLMNTVAEIPGTEIIKESTANGQANDFYLDWKNAKNGKSNYQAIFVPWYWQDEYSIPDESFVPDEEEQLLLEEFGENGLNLGHLNWRRIKINALKGDYEQKRRKFRQEYPFTDEEAFLSSVTDTFIQAEHVKRARNNKVESHANLIVGVDPARKGDDRTAIIRRKGRRAFGLETHHSINLMQLAGIIKRIIEKESPRRVCIDSIGIGAGVVDRLHELGYADIVIGVNVATTAQESDKFKNTRAELWSAMRDWFTQDSPVEIPDSDELQTDLTILGYGHDSSDKLLIESKKEAKKRGCLSPDTADALMLTFYGGEYVQDGGYEPRRLPEHTAGMLI